MFSAFAISSMVAKWPVSSSFRQRKPRARAFRRALSTRVRGAGAEVTPSGVSTRVRPPRLREEANLSRMRYNGWGAAVKLPTAPEYRSVLG